MTFSKDLWVLTSKSVPELLNKELDLLVGSDHANIVDESENKESPLLVIEYTLLVVTLNQIETCPDPYILEQQIADRKYIEGEQIENSRDELRMMRAPVMR